MYWPIVLGSVLNIVLRNQCFVETLVVPDIHTFISGVCTDLDARSQSFQHVLERSSPHQLLPLTFKGRLTRS